MRETQWINPEGAGQPAIGGRGRDRRPQVARSGGPSEPESSCGTPAMAASGARQRSMNRLLRCQRSHRRLPGSSLRLVRLLPVRRVLRASFYPCAPASEPEPDPALAVAMRALADLRRRAAPPRRSIALLQSKHQRCAPLMANSSK